MALRKCENGAAGARRVTVEHDDIAATLYTQHRVMAAFAAGETYISPTPNRADARIDDEPHGIYVLFPVGDRLALAGCYDDGDGDAGVIFYVEFSHSGWQVGKYYFEFDNNEVEGIQNRPSQIPLLLSQLMEAK